MGLLAYAFPAPLSSLERATEQFREFREQPTAELARVAGLELRAATSSNERLQREFHPWTSYVIVPLFALANAGIAIDADFLSRAFTSPLTLGILFGYVVGKPVGILGSSWLLTRLTRGRLQPPVGWAAVAGGGTIAGIGFTVALLVATLAFDGGRLEEAKLGILSAALGAALVTWLLFRATELLPRRQRTRALLGTAPGLVDLYIDVDPERDHVRGPINAPVTVVEYGDFECPYCGLAEPVVPELLAEFGDVRYVWRHLPLNDVHPKRPAGRGSRRHARCAGMPAELVGEAVDVEAQLLRVRDEVAGGERALVGEQQVVHLPERALVGRRLQRRPQRCLRDAHVLHQRPQALRRLRHRDPVGGRAGGRRAGDAGGVNAQLSARRRSLGARR
jgi:hypothetical protein